MQNVFVVTHAQSQHHLEDRVGGWYDTGLTDLGRRQAKAAAKRLDLLTSGTNISLVSSDLKRASETAEIIGAVLGSSVSLDKGLRENSYGEADGKPQSWLDERIVVAPEDDRLDHIVVAGAESKRTFIERIYGSMSQLPLSSDVVIVTHGYALTFVIAYWIGVIAYWIGMRIEDAAYVNFAATPAGITHLMKDDFFRNNAVKFLNNAAHLIDV